MDKQVDSVITEVLNQYLLAEVYPFASAMVMIEKVIHAIKTQGIGHLRERLAEAKKRLI